MNITIIAAIGNNNELGNKNNLIWHIPEDLNFFKNYTMNKFIVMGANTFKSLPNLLPNRKHIILTHQDIKINNVLIFHSLSELLSYIKKIPEEITIIGGASIYKQFIDYANKMIITHINDSRESDTYFPKIIRNDWHSETIYDGEFDNIKYKRLKYIRNCIDNKKWE